MSVKRLLDCTPSDLARYTKAELLDAIAGSEGRVLACETIGLTPPLLVDVTNAEYAASLSADILLLNMFDVQHPVINALPKVPEVETVRELKRLTGRVVGINLEPCDLQAAKSNDGTLWKMSGGRLATVENARRAVEMGVDLIVLTGNPGNGVSNELIVEALKAISAAVGDRVLLAAGKMHASGVAGEGGEKIMTPADAEAFMAAGADMASVSMHKSGGSLTQSSLLLTGPNVHAGYVRQIINLTQTTSGSYLLMSSLDISRRNLAQRGRQIFHQVADMAEYAREEINAIGGYYAFGKELVNGDSVFDFDITKLSVHTLDIGLAGIEVYDILRDEYDIQIEFGDIGNILAYLSIGDRVQEIERLVSALAEIRRRFQKDKSGLLDQEYIDPQVVTSPQEAFYAEKCSPPLRETEGKVCSEFVMCYPPGIPILAPGERITPEILDYIEYAKSKGCSMTGPEDPKIEHINILTDGGKPHGIMV